MINYGKILLMHEKDNPSPFLRATYLFSNVGDLVKCYGRSIRFPEDKKLYEAEMKLAIADILMQCRMALEEKGYAQIEINELDTKNDTIENSIKVIAFYSGSIVLGDKSISIPGNITRMIIECYTLCELLGGLKGHDIEHLGFIHVMERFNEFERRGWK
jgi:hypothetical protein